MLFNRRCKFVFIITAFSCLYLSGVSAHDSPYPDGQILTITTDSVAATPSSYFVGGRTYQWGQGVNKQITGFTYNGINYGYKDVADGVVLRRVDNAQSSGDKPCDLFSEMVNQPTNPNKGNFDPNYYVLEGDYPDNGLGDGGCDMEAVMSGRRLNVGTLDIFSNTGTTAKNIERSDFIFDSGILAPPSLAYLPVAGHIMTEKSGNNVMKIAVITSLDLAGEPASYGPLVTVCVAESLGVVDPCYGATDAPVSGYSTGRHVHHGLTNFSADMAFLSNNPPAQNAPSYSWWFPEPLGMAFVSLEILGLTAGQRYYGFSYFPADVRESVHNLVDPSSFPRNTSAATYGSGGNADNYGGAAAYFIDDSLEFDYGDAPGYAIVQHEMLSDGVHLGSSVDDDRGQWGDGTDDNGNASDDDTEGTDDEDGVRLSGSDLQGQTLNGSVTYTLQVTTQGSGALNAWIDWNQDGDFWDVGEQIANDVDGSSGSISLSVVVPSTVLSGTTYARFRYNTGGGLDPASPATNGEVEDYRVITAMAPACAALTGEVSEVGAEISRQINVDDLVFVASSRQSPDAGHLRAYKVLAGGAIKTTSEWDAANEMTEHEREHDLYSTTSAGVVIEFENLDSAAFAAGASPDKDDIIDYTLDPSDNGGAYLAGRESGSFLGMITRGNDIVALDQTLNTSYYLLDTAYRSFYSDDVSSREERVMVTSDDGFLYMFDQSDGDLAWGWMPRSLVKELKNYVTFQANHFMMGKQAIVDAKASDGTFSTYIVGNYKSGVGHYSLKLDDDGDLESVIWDEDDSASFNRSPNYGEMDFFTNGSVTYAAYIMTNLSNDSTLVIRRLDTDSGKVTVALGFHATSSPYVVLDFDDPEGPAAKTIYVGDNNGNIYSAPLLQGNGNLRSAANIQSALASPVGTLGANEPVLFLGIAPSLKGGYAMRAQSQNRFTVLKYNTSTAAWLKQWSSYVGGSESWDANGNNPTADATIQALPAGAIISDAAQIVAGNIVLPVKEAPASAAVCYSSAYFYLYRLAEGKFPVEVFRDVDGDVITTNIFIGYGTPTRITISDMASEGKTIGYGSADQLNDNSASVNFAFDVRDSVTEYRAWKELK